MSLRWNTYLVRPLLPGGSGHVSSNITVDGDTLLRAVAKVGLAPATAWDDPAQMTVELNLGNEPGDGSDQGTSFYGATANANAVVSFFAETQGGGWAAGPIIMGVDLTPHYDSAFPWVKTMLVALLQQLAVEKPPALPSGKSLAIRTAFPRDTGPMPCLSVQMTNATPIHELIGDTEYMPALKGKTAKKTRGYHVTIDLIAWAAEPEMREAVGPWLGSALDVLVETLEYFGVQNPSFTLQESEDFQLLGTPTFLVTGTLTGIVWTNLSFPVPTGFGHLETP